MSYDIMYNSGAIRLDNGRIIPVVLLGSNNVVETSPQNSKYERLARSWSVFGRKISYSEDEFRSLCESFTGHEYQEHWKQNGKWVDDAGLMRWAKGVVHSAGPLEGILAENGESSVHCYIYGYGKHNYFSSRACDQYVHNNKELEEWIARVEQVRKEELDLVPSERRDWFPVIAFPREDMVRYSGRPDKVCLRSGKKYLSGYTQTSLSFSHEVKDSKILDYDEAMSILTSGFWNHMGLRVIPVPKAIDAKESFAVNVQSSKFAPGSKWYVQQVRRNTLTYTQDPKLAKRYYSNASVQSAIKRMSARYRKTFVAEAM